MNTLERALEILGDLVKYPSVSSISNADVSQYVAKRLAALPMRQEILPYQDSQQIEKVNVTATTGSGTGGLVYCAHTDVVPVDVWDQPHSKPFQLHEHGDRFYGRGSCDMKGSLACFLAALETFLAEVPADRLRAPVSVICTADEEVGYHGAAHVAAHSKIYRDLVQQQPVTLIGEPTTLKVVHAHKGIYVFRATSRGIAGHSGGVTGVNANRNMIPFLQEMWQIAEDVQDAADWHDSRFTPSGISWNIGINDFTYATNITPERSVATVCFRPMPGQLAETLVNRAQKKAEALGLEFELTHGARPVYVEPESSHIQQMLKLTGETSSCTVSYGTDAAMFDELQQTVICGPGDIAQAHTTSEWISREQMQRGVEIYRKLIEHFCL